MHVAGDDMAHKRPVVADILDAHATAGIRCIIDLHNYCRYRDFVFQPDGSVIGLVQPRAGTNQPGELFDKIYYDQFKSRTPVFNPWYVPEWAFNHGGARPDDNPDFNGTFTDQLGNVLVAPWEGIGTGWFYSVLGGGMNDRPTAQIANRVPLTFDNTYDAMFRGDFPVPTVFNGNFNSISNTSSTSSCAVASRQWTKATSVAMIDTIAVANAEVHADFK